MPKRSAEEKINYYNAKIKKLERRSRKDNRRSRVIVYSTSSDSEKNEDNGAQQIVDTNDMDDSSTISAAAVIPPPSGDPAPPPPADRVAPSAPVEPIAPPLADPVALPADTITLTETESVPELDPALLQALGDPADDTPAYGSDIHEKLAQRWLPILKKGLQKESKEQLLKDYAIPGNCKLLKAPTLNPEISAAISETVRSRDKKMQAKQDQMGLGITAVNRAMSLLLTGDDKVQAVKILSDACRILSDLHFVETQVRTKLITPGLDKAFLSLIQDQDRDETLFGAKLPDKIKASKAIEKQGLQIKKGPIPKPSTSNSAFAAARNCQQGNWRGPPRLTPSSRGGHTAAYRTPAAYRRPPPAAQPATTRSSAATAANKRPQARQ